MKPLFLALNSNYTQGLTNLSIDESTLAFAIVFMLLLLHALSYSVDKKQRR